MSVISRADVEAVVTPEENVVVTSIPRCRNMYGALAGKVPDVSPEEIADERRQAWSDLAERRQRTGHHGRPQSPRDRLAAE